MRDFENNRTQIMNSIENRVRQAYNSGYDTGFRDGEIAGYNNWQDGRKDGFRKGLEEAWECARKLTHPSYGGFYDDEQEKIFGYRNSDDILTKFTAEEAIEKIREYESKLNEPDKEIKVGDEIVYETGAKSVVSKISNDFYYCLDGVGYPKERCEKTGRHFPQIEEVLKATEGAADEQSNIKS